MSVAEESSDWSLYKGRLEVVDELPLMSSPWPVLAIIASYWLFVLKIGPMYMSKRQPFVLREVLVLYNGLQVVNCVNIGYQCAKYFLDNGIIVTQCGFSINKIQQDIVVRYTYIYVLTKIADLMDTVFFVLRKKQSQVSFLHLYHHSLMVLATWMSLKYDPSDSWLFLGLANCFIHSVMYTYYALAAMGPRFQKYLWWKKHLTKMQLAQFVIIMIHLYVQTNVSPCPVSRFFYWIAITNGFIFVCLFTDFYLKRYKVDKKEVSEVTQKIAKHM